jgi:general nucleoside transport system ATP-binding protein
VPDTALTLEHITKSFGALVANDDISMSLQRGEVLGLLGENGAGKSTLVSILFGHYVADSGSITVFGTPLKPGDPKAALAAGIGMVHQHFTLADNLSVLDNVMLGSEPLWQPFSRRKAGRAKLLNVAERFGLPVQPDALVANLSVGERQRVEIIKALYRGAKILIMDEPTAVLTPQESEALFGTLQKLVEQGLSVIFISHKLAEVLRVCHRVAVLRNGQLAATAQAKATDKHQLAKWMVGHAVREATSDSTAKTALPGAGKTSSIVCDLQAISARGNSRHFIDQISLQLRAGEIVAIAGVSGNGQGALADVLFGNLPLRSGHMTLHGENWPVSNAAARLTALGVARIPEDRRSMGVVGDLPLWENAVSERLRSHAFSRHGWVKRNAAVQHAQRIATQFDVRGAGLASRTALLSGGNMQKLILGRALLAPDGHSSPSLIVAHQPTWGLDIGAVTYVHQQLVAARNAGAAVLLISDDLDEVTALGDRVAVMHAGKLTDARPAIAWTRETLGMAMAGS